MTHLLLILFAGLCLFLIGWGLYKPGRICEFPFLAGATFAGFILPQAVGIAWSEAITPPGLDDALWMSILCAGMCYLGYVVSDKPMTGVNWEFDHDRLVIAGGVLSAVGAFFFILIGRLPPELVETGGWTGVVVAYFFFAQVIRYGFALTFLLWIKKRSKLALAILLFDGVFLFNQIVIRGRRSFTIETLLVVLCTFWFMQRKTLPRWCVFALLPLGALAVFGTATYRATMYKDQAYGGHLQHELPWREILEIDFVDVFVKSQRDESYEVRNLAHLMRVTDTHDGGLSYWNELVFIFVPAQVVGAEFKESLQFDVPGQLAVMDPTSPGGTTITGMGDSYQAFGWFGCLVFFVIAFVLRRLFETAQSGNLAAQLIYMLIITGTMVTITHHTKWFLTAWIHMSVFVLPWLIWARKPVVPVPAPGEVPALPARICTS